MAGPNTLLIIMNAKTPIIVRCRRFADNRGWFSETYNEKTFEKFGLSQRFVQDNHSVSFAAWTIRGLHFQRPPHAQAKLVHCVRGRILDMVVDIRTGSPSFGRYIATVLSDKDGGQLLVPAGFAHGFVTLTDNTEVMYKVTDFYAPECDDGLRWNDPTLAIDWRLPTLLTPTLSRKDAVLPLFSDFASPFVFRSDDLPLSDVQEVVP